jgi:hypothetical protein
MWIDAVSVEGHTIKKSLARKRVSPGYEYKDALGEDLDRASIGLGGQPCQVGSHPELLRVGVVDFIRPIIKLNYRLYDRE